MTTQAQDAAFNALYAAWIAMSLLEATDEHVDMLDQLDIMIKTLAEERTQ